jgi:lysozyme
MNALLQWLRGLLAAWRAGQASSPGAAGAQAPTVADAADATPEQPASVAPAVPEAPAGAAPRRINAAGLALVKASEGLRLTAYQDSGGVWTIGYGHTGRYPDESSMARTMVGAGDAITAEDAELILSEDLADAEASAEYYSAGLSDDQFSALVDFTFNLGPGALAQLLAHGLDQVPEQLLRWDHAAGVELAGLKLRREREAQLWRTGSWA